MSPSDGASDQPVRRAPVVYGKRSNNLPPVDPADEHEHVRVRDTLTAPSHRRTPSPHASDGERSGSPDAVDPFQFSFRHRLKELDKQFDNHDTPSSELGLFPGNKAMHLQSVPAGTGAPCSSRAPSPSPTSPSATYAQEYAPGASPVRRRTEEVLSPALPHSETGDPSDSSSISPIRHAITTPHSHSSPTPPTSGEFLMASRKTKGKTPVRDVLPLLFDDERPSAVEIPIKSKKGGRSKASVRPKTKAPTKKERREAAFESSRIAASRPVDVRRTQAQRHSLPAFFASLRRDNIAVPTLGAELPSDPIERFSSPTDKSALVQSANSLFGAPLGFFGASAHVEKTSQPSPPRDTDALAPAAAGSDDEMPSVFSIIQQTKRKQLQAIKRVALQHADASKAMDGDSEDDDLLVVKDDMHSVARQEAAQRRLDKVHGSPAKDGTSSRRMNHPSVFPAVISPRKFSKQDLQELAKPSFARTGQGVKGRLSKKQLDQLMIIQHTEEQLKSIKRQEEEWVRRGGRLSRDTGDDDATTSLSQRLEAYAEQGLNAMSVDGATGDEASTDESDRDYIPDLQGSSSLDPVEGDTPNGNIDLSQAPRSPKHDGEEEEEEVIALKRNERGQRRLRAVVGSDDEGAQPVQRGLPTVQRDSASSMGSQTEDENDKENSTELMYDRSEDKENKAVVRHELSSPGLAFGSRLSSLHGIGDGARRSPDYNDIASSPRNDRSPLKDISKDEDGFFLSPPSKPPATGRLLERIAISPSRSSAPAFNLGLSPVLRSERVSQMDRLSLDSENPGDNGFKVLQPSFVEISSKSSLATLNPLADGGFSQLFSAEDLSLKKSADKAETDGLALTLDVGLKPALEVSSTLRHKAEIIFEKEQEYVVAAAVQQNDKSRELLYVNDHGFLTQTRPEGSSPQIYRMTPSQASKFVGTQVYATQMQSLNARPPLRTLSFTTSQDLSPEPQPLRRLRKRSLSPLEQRALGQNSNPATKPNAFNILGKAPKPLPRTQDKTHDKSEFVAVEAEESDEDDTFGFGGPKKEDDEEDENEQDKVVEGLVDDTLMDVEIEAADLVQEKYREHEEEDDQRLQRLHQDAIEGKFRMKRRDRGVGLDDDSDEDDDDDERRIRQRIYKKRRIEGDNLEALGQNEETRAFYDTYHQDLVDEDDEFGYLRGDHSIPPDGDTQPDEPEEQETVSVDEIRQRVREMVENNYEVEALDPEDTSWVDHSMIIEAEDTFHVNVVDGRRNKPAAHRPHAGQIDFDEQRATRHEESEQERRQMTSWAKNLNRGRQGTGRPGNTTAVTGHTKARSGGGSLRPTQSSNSATVGVAHKAKSLSLLSTMCNRSGKFT